MSIKLLFIFIVSIIYKGPCNFLIDWSNDLHFIISKYRCRESSKYRYRLCSISMILPYKTIFDFKTFFDENNIQFPKDQPHTRSLHALSLIEVLCGSIGRVIPSGSINQNYRFHSLKLTISFWTLIAIRSNNWFPTIFLYQLYSICNDFSM